MLKLDKVVELTFPLCLLKSDSLLHVQYACKSQQGPLTPMISAPSYPKNLGRNIEGRKVSIIYLSAFDLSAAFVNPVAIASRNWSTSLQFEVNFCSLNGFVFVIPTRRGSPACPFDVFVNSKSLILFLG